MYLFDDKTMKKLKNIPALSTPEKDDAGLPKL